MAHPAKLAAKQMEAARSSIALNHWVVYRPGITSCFVRKAGMKKVVDDILRGHLSAARFG